MTDIPVKYHEECLIKKEGKGKWKDYWVVVRGSWMLFYANKNITDRSNFRGSLELSKDTKCSVSKRRHYSFPFYITTQRGTHLFKCSTNLQRHQWLSAIDLAIKGFPPLPPPTYVPKPAIKDNDGNFVSSWDTSSSDKNKELSDDILDNIIDDDDYGKDDDDDLSLPPGVITVVSILPDDLKQFEGDGENQEQKEMILNSINKGQNIEHRVPLNAVLSTGITGSTSVVQEKNIRSNELNIPKHIGRPVSKSTGSLKDGQFRHYFMTSHSSSHEERPSTSPLLSTIRRKPLSYSPMNSTTNLKFSRHMTNSAPDVKTLAFDNIVPR